MAPSCLRNLNRIIAAFIIFAALALAGSALAWSTFQELLEPRDPESGDTVVVVLAPGTSSRRVAELLEERGIIRSAAAFYLYVRLHDLGRDLRAGEYELSPAMAVPDIVARLVRGQVVTYTLTIPEGYTVERILDAAAATGFFEREALRRAVDAAAADWPYLPDGADLQEPLEGYLFPDTYLFTRTTSEEQLVAAMLRGFERTFTHAWRRRAQELGLTVHQVVTLASIIEREARVPEERALISAVYHNRLRLGMKLDADPTVLYALGRTDGRLLYHDLEVDSPYNTYRYAGLPPGPIASPGAASLEAALYPADVDYLYFVSKNDGTGAHAFARTYAEHLSNVRRYRDR